MAEDPQKTGAELVTLLRGETSGATMELLDNLHGRVWSLENDRRASDYDEQALAQRDEAIARRDLARLQLKLWRRLLSTPARLLDRLHDFVAMLRQ